MLFHASSNSSALLLDFFVVRVYFMWIYSICYYYLKPLHVQPSLLWERLNGFSFIVVSVKWSWNVDLGFQFKMFYTIQDPLMMIIFLNNVI